MDTHDIILAAQGKSLNAYLDGDRKEAIRASVDLAYRLSELPVPPGADYEQLVTDIEGKIMRSYPYLTNQELALVCESGVAGELGSRTRPSTAAILGWLAAYMNSDLRKEAIRNYRRGNTSDPASGLKTPDEIAELNRQAEMRALNTLWQEYKANGRILETEHFRGYVAMAMDGAVKRQLFRILPEHWEAARKEAAHNRLRIMRSALGIRGAAPDVPDSVVKWVMLEMCFAGQKASGRDLIVNS